MEPMDNSILDQTPVQQYTTAPSNLKKGGKKVWIIIVLVAGAIVAFLFLKPSGTKTQEPTIIIAPTETAPKLTISEDEKITPTPEPTVAEKVAAGPSIQVQNGSGTEGVAGKMQTALKDSGYDAVTTGNADNFDHTGVAIKSKDSVLATAKKIKTQLKDYTFDAEIAVLSEDSDFDIIVVVGK